MTTAITTSARATRTNARPNARPNTRPNARPMLKVCHAALGVLAALGALPAQHILDPGLVRTGCRVARAHKAIAQTFRPTSTGTVDRIEHGLDATRGLRAFHLYVTEATPAGIPPANYRDVAIYTGLNLTAFSNGAQRINGSIQIPAAKRFLVSSSKSYALVFERVGGGQLMSRQASGGGAYSRGDGYVWTGSAWSTYRGCSGTRHDLAFRIHGCRRPTSSEILDPGLPRTGCKLQGFWSVIAQTFRPLKSGKVTEIVHGVDRGSDLSARFHLYVTPVTSAGLPPTNYKSVAIYAAFNLSAFSNGGQTAVGSVKIPSGREFRVSNTKSYALIIESASSRRLNTRQTSGGGAYSRGDAYRLAGANWVTARACSNAKRSDLAFRILGRRMVLSAPTPGLSSRVNTWALSGGIPNQLVFYVVSLKPATVFLDPYGCGGVTLDLFPSYLFLSTTDACGDGALALFVPALPIGTRVYTQALQLGCCVKSNLVQHVF